MKSDSDSASPSLLRALGFKFVTWVMAIGVMVWAASALGF